MSDVKAVRYLLANNASLIAVVPAARIFSGVIPQGTTLPALGVSHVSTVRRQAVSNDTFCTARVQVTVLAATYPTQKSILALVRAAVTRKPGTVNSVKVDTILKDLEGPDFRNDAVDPPIYMQSQDFIVHYTE